MIKQNNIKRLKAKLDRYFSLFIRLRDTNEFGYGFCISCRKIVFYKNADAGHFINRSYLATRYEENNCHLQCRHCNRFKEGRLYEYSKVLEEKIGVKEIERLQSKKYNITKWTAFEYEELIKIYKGQINDLMKTKNFEL